MPARERNTRKRSVNPDDAPALTGHEISRPDARWRIGGRDVSAAEGKQAFRDALIRKTRINIHVDNDVLAYFRQQAGARGYQTLINKALRHAMNEETKSHGLQEIKEEVQQLRADLNQLLRQEPFGFATPVELLQAPKAPPLGSALFQLTGGAPSYSGALSAIGGRGRQHDAQAA